MKYVWNELKSCGVFIGWWGMKFEFFRNFYHIFWSYNGKRQLVFQFKRSNLYSNGPIMSCHLATTYRLQGMGGSAGATDRALLPGPAPTRAILFGPGGLQPYCPHAPPAQRQWVLPPSVRTRPPSGPAVAPAIGTSLRLVPTDGATTHTGESSGSPVGSTTWPGRCGEWGRR
jgi:hypothetical protein